MSINRVYFNTIAQIAGKFSTAFISIFLIKVLTSYLSVEDYGLYTKLYNYLSIFAVIADLGLFTITIREISANKDREEEVEKIVGNMLAIRLCLGFMIIFLSLLIAKFLPGYNSTVALYGVFIVSIFVFFGLINSAIISLLQAYLKTEFTFISNTLGKISSFIFILFIVFIIYPKDQISGNALLQERAFLWLLIGGVFGNIVMTLLVYLYSRRIHKIKLKLDFGYIKKLLKMSLPFGIAMFLNVVYFKVDVILISLLEPKQVADMSVGLYSVPMKIVEVGMLFGGLFLQSMLPLFTETIKKKNYLELKNLVEKAYGLLFVFGIGILVFSLSNGYEVLRLISNTDYLDSTYRFNSLDSFRITAFIFVIFFITSIFTYLLIASSKQKKLLKINLYISIFNVILNFILIPQYSFIGASISTLLSQIILLTLTYFATRELLRFDFLPKFSFTVLFIGIIGFFLNTYMRNYLYLNGFNFMYVFLICGLIFSVFYLGLVVNFFYKKQVKNIFGQIKKYH